MSNLSSVNDLLYLLVYAYKSTIARTDNGDIREKRANVDVLVLLHSQRFHCLSTNGKGTEWPAISG